ncbi:MAG: hypothetical protein IJO33_03540 [Bacilli bacterium]|nr:hypothetical protein [Bacilli bacterium]
MRGEIEKPFYIIGPKGISQKVNDLMAFAFGNLGSLKDYANIEFIELESNEELTINDYTLASIDLIHGKATPNYGYLLKKDEVIIGYTGDSTLCDNFVKMCESANIIIVDTTRKEKSDKAHIGLVDLTNIADQYANCKFYAVHRSDYELPTDSKVIFPQDGDEVEI